jgi:molybdopterin-guanine dinucleotide biosynthesis protein A
MSAGVPSAAQITGAVLAGGASTRMGGVDKGLAELFGKPLVAHVIAVLHLQVDDILIIANRQADAYARHAPVQADSASGFRGPLAGIATALAACRTPWLLTVPVDCPRIATDLAARLGQAIGEGACTVAHDGERRQPLFALYRRELAVDAANALERNLPVWNWQDACGVREVDFSDQAATFANLNSAEEFRRWERDHA